MWDLLESISIGVGYGDLIWHIWLLLSVRFDSNEY